MTTNERIYKRSFNPAEAEEGFSSVLDLFFSCLKICSFNPAEAEEGFSSLLFDFLLFYE